MNTLQTMRKKLKNKKGFTLMEMLIVVAIIAILIAIAVPTFSSALDNAKKTVDEANVRAAQSEALADYASHPATGGTSYAKDNQGKPYQIQSNSGIEYAGSTLNKGEYVTVKINADNTVDITGSTKDPSKP